MIDTYDMRLGTKQPQPKIFGFIHTATIGNWKEVLAAQLRRVKYSGLYDRTELIHIGKLGTEHYNFTDPKVHVFSHPNIHLAEGFTLSVLQEHCRANRNCLVWYIHTKGISRVNEPNVLRPIRHWRFAMEHFVIDNHQACVDELKTHDVCGSFWYNPNPFDGAHFSGNFWWANAWYVNTLPDVNRWVETCYMFHQKRIRYEFWIGSNPAVKPHSFFQTPKEAGKLYEDVVQFEHYGRYFL